MREEVRVRDRVRVRGRVRVRVGVARTTSGRRATGLVVGAVLASCGWCSRHMAVGGEVR